MDIFIRPTAFYLDPKPRNLCIRSVISRFFGQSEPALSVAGGFGRAQVLGILGAVIVPPWVAGAAVLLDNLYLKTKPLPVSLTLTATPSLADSHKSEKNQV